MADALRTEERELGRGYKWRGAFRRMQEQLLALEADSKALELIYPQARSLNSSDTSRAPAVI